MCLAAFLGWGSFASILMYLNPASYYPYGVILFYLSLFIGFSSILSLAGFYIRRRRQVEKVALLDSFRQGILLGMAPVFSLFLQSRDLFKWWIVGLFFIIVLLIEIYSQIRSK